MSGDNGMDIQKVEPEKLVICTTETKQLEKEVRQHEKYMRRTDEILKGLGIGGTSLGIIDTLIIILGSTVGLIFTIFKFVVICKSKAKNTHQSSKGNENTSSPPKEKASPSRSGEEHESSMLSDPEKKDAPPSSGTEIELHDLINPKVVTEK